MRLTRQMRQTLQAMGSSSWTLAELAEAMGWAPYSSLRGRLNRATKAGWVEVIVEPAYPTRWRVAEAGRQAAVKP
jgi:hypothetical protein